MEVSYKCPLAAVPCGRGPCVCLADAGCEVEVRLRFVGDRLGPQGEVHQQGRQRRDAGGGRGRGERGRLRLTCDTVVTALHSRSLRLPRATDKYGVCVFYTGEDFDPENSRSPSPPALRPRGVDGLEGPGGALRGGLQ